ncbi:tetratricopeptide (TPR) repeat protein [Paenibacillus shirakamiensis]|uniref:Tetratricopeptide (TPR) repeat protein n=1 Tax=Paenibacillus shirakamiensis TaxID=1265935 RepID=A0ABS4JCY8_9BACL|nr:tetratricopeptide repeat protein [Paenibacillus shirakamiensis]MBP1999568.1 tetratricopeptide (TPR) repeat protein [Paenibacillus shirakamiensis]
MTQLERFLAQAYKSILNHDFEQAIQWFDRAIGANPLDADIHFRCSVTCARSGRMDKAVFHASEAVRLDSDTEEYKLQYERLQAREMRLSAVQLFGPGGTIETDNAILAVSLLEQSTAFDPLYGESFVWLASAYEALERYPDALAAVREALALQNDSISTTSLKKWEQRFISKINQSSL